ncbi:NADPH oxidase 4-like [Stylophora pistillata]|uniref:NADPH oxidase 4-like n=1 Tax=Stylophora pistillata TaxID=50429 RepID=UPI000C04ADE4|nr:NADPH oxidase 4-like [Stylophora pistillata]XP_022795532.1 NADPH oxidase 4-like [Stylophora pistillata]
MVKKMTVRLFFHWIIRIIENLLAPASIAAIAVLVFLRTFYTYRDGIQYYYLYAMLGDSLCWSRGTASVLYVSCCLILLPMCRNVLSLIRNFNKTITRLFGRLLDRNIWFHKACAVVIIVSAGIHIGAHIVNAKKFSANYSHEFKDLNFASYPNQDPLKIYLTSVSGTTGILMTLVLLIMIATSMVAVRRASYEIFWYTHHLFIVFFLLLLVHGLGGVIKHQVNLDAHTPGCKMAENKTESANTSQVAWCSEEPLFQADEPEAWKWCAIPLVIYVTERLTRLFRSFQKVQLIQVVQHRDGVVEVKMKKRNFSAAPGQYVFIKCADVSRFEWHPFTLTQCPSLKDSTFSVHFKILGDWTEKFADKLLEAKFDGDQKNLACVEQNEEYFCYVRHFVKIAVDGPYGSPCTDVWRYSVSLCIATGIGVTPFAALVQELREKIRTEKKLKMHRLYFVWVCKHVQSFLWFVDLLRSTFTELWDSNRPDFLICNFYVTCSHSGDQININQQDKWLTGRLHKSKPSWKALFDRVSRENPRTRVGLFYCGSRKVTSTLKKRSKRFYPTGTRFIFNKEILT